jgi:hypothetical protein
VSLVSFSSGAQVASSNISSRVTAHRDSTGKIFGNSTQANFTDYAQAIFGDPAQTIFSNWEGWSLLKARESNTGMERNNAKVLQ